MINCGNVSICSNNFTTKQYSWTTWSVTETKTYVEGEWSGYYNKVFCCDAEVYPAYGSIPNQKTGCWDILPFNRCFVYGYYGGPSMVYVHAYVKENQRSNLANESYCIVTRQFAAEEANDLSKPSTCLIYLVEKPICVTKSGNNIILRVRHQGIKTKIVYKKGTTNLRKSVF